MGTPKLLPVLLVDSGSAINGTVHLYQEVRLDIESGATVGRIIRHYERDAR